MSGETEFYAIPVTAEWALWGKEPSDLEYRLLRCSDGILSDANFDELLTRYATGTLEVLPQVTIGWLEDRPHGHQIALSIHEEPADRRIDATGRPVVLTRCFCVPYATLAEGRVSYQAMYDVFRKIPLYEQGHVRDQSARHAAGQPRRPVRRAGCGLAGDPQAGVRTGGRPSRPVRAAPVHRLRHVAAAVRAALPAVRLDLGEQRVLGA